MEDIESKIEEEPRTEEVTSTWELDISDILRLMDEYLGGVYYEVDETGKIVIKRDKDLALINPKGLRYLKSRILLLANKWVALSNIDKKEVKKFCLLYADGLRMELRARKDEFEIKRHNFETLVLATTFFIFMAISKAVGEGERRYRRGIERRIVEFARKTKRGVTDTLFSMFKS